MFVESLSLRNFRCFGPDTQYIRLSPGLTAFIAANGSGKTAVTNALLRLFGVTSEQRRMRRQDFHVPPTDWVAAFKSVDDMDTKEAAEITKKAASARADDSKPSLPLDKYAGLSVRCLRQRINGIQLERDDQPPALG